MYKTELSLYGACRGTFGLELGGNILVEMEIYLENGLLTVYSTNVYNEGSNSGVRAVLVDELAEYARRQHLRIVALCPFVHYWFSMGVREYRDVWSRTGVRDKHQDGLL